MKKYLFNFAASYSGGGYKRLYEYSKWFNENGGAYFIVNNRCAFLIDEFTNNKYFLVDQNIFQRVFNDDDYLKDVINTIKRPVFYYSYGIPIYKKIADVNWFHLSNVLPIIPFKIPMSFSNRLKFIYLGIITKNGFKNSDIISAESNFSLNLINPKYKSKLFLSVNGGDDEISHLNNKLIEKKEDIALVIGTQWYKAIKDSYYIYEMLKSKEPRLKLVIIGNDKYIPSFIKNDKDIEIINKFLDRIEIVNYLKKSKYYISTTMIENSYNAISEGIFFADESFISDIEPHQELLKNLTIENVSIPNIKRSIIHIYRNNINGANLKSWNDIIIEMINKINGINKT
ncbi:MAG: hypothetical protein NTZ33_12420 [Bacteroidetes bacterium]|nr:hypothetical protein [Bacteroidota bacterium]